MFDNKTEYNQMLSLRNANEYIDFRFKSTDELVS